MKSIKPLLYPILLLLISCGLAAVDPDKAKAVAESLMNDMKREDYSKLDSYYTADSNESEPLAKKVEKFQKLREVMGPIQSYELLSAREDASSDHGGPKIELKYKLKCANTTVIHTLLIINDEGTHKISFQNFEN